MFNIVVMMDNCLFKLYVHTEMIAFDLGRFCLNTAAYPFKLGRIY